MDSDNEYGEPWFTPRELRHICIKCFQEKQPLLIFGSPGQGKSTIIEDVCKEMEYDLIISHPVVDNPTDYKGFPALVEHRLKDGKSTGKQPEFLPFNDLKQLVETENDTVHFADDLGPAPKMVQCAYGQMILNRGVGSHKISDNVTFVAATNRKEDKAGVQGIISMLVDRFIGVIGLRNSLEDWVQWYYRQKPQLPHEIASYVRWAPDVLNEFKPTPDLSRTPTPRGLHACAKIMMMNFGEKYNMRMFASSIGKERAQDLIGFLRLYKDLPDPDAVIMDPKGAEIPDGQDMPDRLYALCGAVSARASQTNIENIITFADRLSDEFSVLVVRDAVTRDHKLTKNNAFNSWFADHQDVLI